MHILNKCHIFVLEKGIDMETNISKALNLLDNRDWYYMMADYGYASRRENARSEMKHYVRLCNNVEDADVREALRALWILKYKRCEDTIAHCFDGKDYDSTAYDRKEEELRKIICS